MPAKRPEWVDRLAQIPSIGSYAQTAHDWWLRSKFYGHREARNLPARRAFAANKPRLNGVQCRVLADLNHRGIATVAFHDLFGDEPLWVNLVTAIGRWLDSTEVKDKVRAYCEGGHRRQAWKEYLVRRYGNDSMLDWDCPWLRLGIEPQLLDIVNSYLEGLSKLIYVDVWNTVPFAKSQPPTGSQRWHRDPEDIKLVKTFLYFTDVDSTSGPLHYVPNSRKGEKYGHLWPQRIPQGSVPPPGAIEEVIPRSEWTVAAHPAGTFIFVDTSGLHMGGRTTEHNRVLATWNYVSPASLWPRVFKLDERETPQGLSTAARFALS